MLCKELHVGQVLEFDLAGKLEEADKITVMVREKPNGRSVVLLIKADRSIPIKVINKKF